MPSMADLLPGAVNPNERTWSDVHGNQIVGEFVAVVGPNVQIKVDGKIQTFPVAGFSPTDQQWLAQQTPNGATGAPGTNPGSMPIPGQMPPGQMPPGYPGSMPPGFPGSMPPSIPGSSPGMGQPGSMTPPRPAMPPGGNGFPGTDSSGGSSAPGYNPGSGGPGAFPGMGASSNISPPPSTGYNPPEMPNRPGFRRFNDILTCENCGAEFSDADGLKEGDACPKCSGGDSSDGTSFRSTRGLIKGIVAIVALAVGAIGWIAKKAIASN